MGVSRFKHRVKKDVTAFEAVWLLKQIILVYLKEHDVNNDTLTCIAKAFNMIEDETQDRKTAIVEGLKNKQIVALEAVKGGVVVTDRGDIGLSVDLVLHA